MRVFCFFRFFTFKRAASVFMFMARGTSSAVAPSVARFPRSCANVLCICVVWSSPTLQALFFVGLCPPDGGTHVTLFNH